jgi:DNA-binding NarL/FixJ family response regulator
LLQQNSHLFLTQQEVAVLRALSEGCHSKEIAAVVQRSKPTVEAIVRILYAKLHARSRAHLVARAIAHGVIPVETVA